MAIADSLRAKPPPARCPFAESAEDPQEFVGEDRSVHTNQSVTKLLAAIHQNFTGLGYSVQETDGAFVIHLPHLVSTPAFTRDEQREQVELLTQIAIKEAQVQGVTFTIRDTTGLEGGHRNWHHFYVEVHVPK
jgi:hypothetical protein